MDVGGNEQTSDWFFGKASGATGGGVWELGDMGVIGNGLFPYILLPPLYLYYNTVYR